MTLDDLTALRNARKDPLDLPRSLTQRELDAYLTETAELDARLAAYRAAADTLADATPRLVGKLAWLKFLKQSRMTLSGELLEFKSPIRDSAMQARAAALAFSIRLIDAGTGVSSLGQIITLAPTPIGQLMAAAGFVTEGPDLHGPRGWQGSLPETERQVAELSKQQAAAKAVVDEMQLTEADRAKRDAEAAAMRDALNTMQIRNNSDGTDLVALTLLGEELPESEMTEAQRAAFTRLRAAG